MNNRSLLSQYGVKRIGLYGSFVRNEQSGESDIDILIDFDQAHESIRNLIAVHDLLNSVLPGKVDVVTLSGLSPYIGPHILREVEYVEESA